MFEPVTLKELIKHYNADGAVQINSGNGSGDPYFDNAPDANPLMTEFPTKEDVEAARLATGDPDYQPLLASDWIIIGQGDNPFKIKYVF